MVPFIRKIEYAFAILILIFFLVSIGKYFIQIENINVSLASSNDNLASTYIARLSNNFFIKNNRNLDAHDFTLEYSIGKWHLITDKNSPEFAVSANPNTGKISLKPLDDDIKNSIVEIDGVKKYFSIGGEINLDIPYEYSLNGSYLVYEQEDMIPIFGYHNIVPDDEEILNPDLEIYQSHFRNQVEYATNILGCDWHTIGDIVQNYLLKKVKTPQNACIVTFDDGNANNYVLAYPILQDNNIKATFYIISGRINTSPKYMSWSQIDDLYRNGHEIGSHTVNTGSLTSNPWVDDKTREKELKYQIQDSKKMLDKRGYNVTTFAYPLGEWDEEVESIVMESGYLAARDTNKDHTWMDRRTSTVSFNDKYIWHLFYIKPESMDTLDKLSKVYSYKYWWQFEDGFRSLKPNQDEDVLIRSTIRPTDTSFAIVYLENEDDAIENKFRLREGGNYFIRTFAAVSSNFQGGQDISDNLEFYVDDILLRSRLEDVNSCQNLSGWDYCNYITAVTLEDGEHTIRIKASKGRLRLDKFQILREVKESPRYSGTLHH
jgi:peptidoglycan/xylan/chitin deacetylase (PgdA/CDA1 family)